MIMLKDTHRFSGSPGRISALVGVACFLAVATCQAGEEVATPLPAAVVQARYERKLLRVGLIRHNDVRNDLKISADQAARLDAIIAELGIKWEQFVGIARGAKALPEASRSQVYGTLLSEQSEALDQPIERLEQILSNEQRSRLDQLELQQSLVRRLLNDSPLGQRIELSDEQKSQIKRERSAGQAKLAELAKELRAAWQLPQQRPSRAQTARLLEVKADYDKKHAAIEEATIDAILKVLHPDQRRRLDELTGKKLTLSTPVPLTFHRPVPE